MGGGAKSIKILIYLSGFNLQRGEKFLTFPEIGGGGGSALS